MIWLKHMAMTMLCVSVILAGVPVQAQPPCPMAAQMQMQQMDMKDCDKMAKQEQDKNGCCCDGTCNAQCMTMGGSASMSLLHAKADLPVIGGQAQQFYAADAVPVSAHLNSQERPPKSLA